MFVKIKTLSMTSCRVALLLLVVCFSGLAKAEDCGWQANGARCSPSTVCCSQWGYCGVTPEHCGTGCQSGSCTGGSPPSPGWSGLSSFFPSSLFDKWFPNCNSFYTYEAFIAAAALYPAFGSSRNPEIQKREVAAFFAHVNHETEGTKSAIAVVGVRSWRFSIGRIFHMKFFEIIDLGTAVTFTQRRCVKSLRTWMLFTNLKPPFDMLQV